MPTTWLRQYDEGECELFLHFHSEHDLGDCAISGWELLSESGGKLLEPRGMDVQYLVLVLIENRDAI